ncbi:MAG: alpha,alpha-trehalase TreF [Bacteroidota bacterium]
MKYLLPLTILLLAFACKQEPEVASQNQPDEVDAQELSIPLPPNELYGKLFRRVQLEQVFPDGKTFVDCIPKVEPDSIMRAYEATSTAADFDLESFVLAHFDLPPEPASGFQADPDRSISEHIKSLWPVLTRRADEEADNASSLIPLPKDYIVPGGRFREIYYWDSYFTMLGLVESDRLDMVENMVDNFAHLIETVGFIPNGNRNYYLTRSQPPFFSMMVELLAANSDDPFAVYRRYLPAMEAEYQWWMEGAEIVSEENPAHLHCVRMADGTILNRYYDRGDYPRAESYREDVETIREAVANGRDSATVARHIRSGAESGWDYSRRWFADGENMWTIETTDLVPPDLNSLLLEAEFNIGYAYQVLGHADQAAYYDSCYDAREAAINEFLYSEESGYFEDFRWSDASHTGRVSLASLFPLAILCADDEHAETVIANLKRDFLAPGGLPATLVETGQQWDAPNGWPPLQFMAVWGIANYEESDDLELAMDITRRWTTNNERVYENVSKMVEKYNVYDLSLEAGGGEYPVQDGFGWSNGVYLAFKSGIENLTVE